MKVCSIHRTGGKPHQLIECSAKLLFGLGLNRFPPLEEIIRMAAGPDEGLRNVALKYFFEKFTAQYASYDPSNEKYASIAFIPATRQNDEFLARPGEVWSLELSVIPCSVLARFLWIQVAQSWVSQS